MDKLDIIVKQMETAHVKLDKLLEDNGGNKASISYLGRAFGGLFTALLAVAAWLFYHVNK